MADRIKWDKIFCIRLLHVLKFLFTHLWTVSALSVFVIPQSMNIISLHICTLSSVMPFWVISPPIRTIPSTPFTSTKPDKDNQFQYVYSIYNAISNMCNFNTGILFNLPFISSHGFRVEDSEWAKDSVETSHTFTLCSHIRNCRQLLDLDQENLTQIGKRDDTLKLEHKAPCNYWEDIIMNTCINKQWLTFTVLLRSVLTV